MHSVRTGSLSPFKYSWPCNPSTFRACLTSSCSAARGEALGAPARPWGGCRDRGPGLCWAVGRSTEPAPGELLGARRALAAAPGGMQEPEGALGPGDSWNGGRMPQGQCWPRTGWAGLSQPSEGTGTGFSAKGKSCVTGSPSCRGTARVNLPPFAPVQAEPDFQAAAADAAALMSPWGN